MLKSIKLAIYLIVMTTCAMQASSCTHNDNIDGALNINVQSDDFKDMAQRNLSKDSTVLVYCRSGRRSLDAAEMLTNCGYKVVNLKGGIIEWKGDGLPVVSEQEN